MPAVDFYLLSAARRAHRLRTGRPYVFGREDGVDLVVQDALVSRRHAELRWSEDNGGFWYIVDLNSRNGVYVNGQRVQQPTRLEDGTQVQIGGQVFRLHLLPPGGDPGSLASQAPQISAQETMAPGLSLGDMSSQGATFTGTITEGGLLELLQFFQLTSKTGRLDLLGAGPLPASIWLAAGGPLHASFNEHQGFEALVRLAQKPPPRFSFHADAPPPGERSLQGSAAAVLMDLARSLDEGKRG